MGEIDITQSHDDMVRAESSFGVRVVEETFMSRYRLSFADMDLSNLLLFHLLLGCYSRVNTSLTLIFLSETAYTVVMILISLCT